MQDFKRLKIAFFTPITNGSKSYYFSTKVLPYLKEHADIDIFTDSKCDGTFCGLNVYHYLVAFKLDNIKNYDIFFYQVEDDDSTNFIRVHLALIPGIVLFHDFYLYNEPPQCIVYYLLGSQFNNIKRDLGKALFSLSTSPSIIKKASKFTRNNIPPHSFSNNNISFIPYPLEIRDFKEKVRNKITKIVFAGNVEKESRYFSVINSLKDISDYKFIWLTKCKDIERAKKVCKDNDVIDFEILENNVNNVEESLCGADICMCPIKNLEYYDTFFIYKAFENNVLVIASAFTKQETNGDDLSIFPSNYILKAKAGLQESKEFSFFINAYKEGRIVLDYKKLYDDFLINFANNVVSKELLALFYNLYDSIKDYKEIYEKQKEYARQKVLSKAFGEYDDYLFNERKELGLL